MFLYIHSKLRSTKSLPHKDQERKTTTWLQETHRDAIEVDDKLMNDGISIFHGRYILLIYCFMYFIFISSYTMLDVGIYYILYILY